MFLVRLHVIQFTRYSFVPFAAPVGTAGNFYILADVVEFVKHFFQVFSNSFSARRPPDLFAGRSSDSLHILADRSLFVKHFLQNSCFIFSDFY